METEAQHNALYKKEIKWIIDSQLKQESILGPAANRSI